MEHRKQVQLYYEEYHRGRVKHPDLRRVRSNLRGFDIQPGYRIIDIGCGLGAAGLQISSMQATPFGLDLSLEAVRASATRYKAVLQADAVALPFPDASFDGATLLGTLEHFVAPGRALREVSRTLKEGSQVCLVVPNSRFFLFRFLGGTGQPHEEARSNAQWQHLFQTEDFAVEIAYRDIGPGIFQGGWVRGIVRKLAVLFFNLLPLEQTYQFVFVCRKPKRSAATPAADEVGDEHQ